MDTNAQSHEYIMNVEKHASQTDHKQGFGGKFGVQTDRQDKSAVGWDHIEKVDKHESQKGMILFIVFYYYISPLHSAYHIFATCVYFYTLIYLLISLFYICRLSLNYRKIYFMVSIKDIIKEK